MTQRQLRRLIKESNLIEGIDDPKEIEQSLIAWDFLYDHNMPLTHGVICKVQKIITLHQPELAGPKRGYYRNMTQINVRVGSYYPPKWQEVEARMENWLEDYARVTPWEAHVDFESIHPFVDGNGRTGRMLMWWQAIKNGEEPLLIKAAERQAYYNLLAGRRAYDI